MADNAPNRLVWCEIPVTEMARAKAFYQAVLDAPLTDNNDGPDPMAMLPVADPLTGAAGHLYPGKPAPAGTGSTVHLAVSGKLEDAIERVKVAGGTIVSPIIEIPSGRFFYLNDLDGNSIGLFAL